MSFVVGRLCLFLVVLSCCCLVGWSLFVVCWVLYVVCYVLCVVLCERCLLFAVVRCVLVVG